MAKGPFGGPRPFAQNDGQNDEKIWIRIRIKSAKLDNREEAVELFNRVRSTTQRMVKRQTLSRTIANSTKSNDLDISIKTDAVLLQHTVFNDIHEELETMLEEKEVFVWAACASHNLSGAKEEPQFILTEADLFDSGGRR